jgi:predicted AAA+ superfamily ATPase
MTFTDRYLTQQIQADLNQKMVFLAGPRQVGKTSIATHLLRDQLSGYLNWDIAAHREFILKHELPHVPLWVFDEIHKYKSWRNYLKGIYDQFGSAKQLLVTGSAKLDINRYGGDSLQGRYHYLRLHPFSVAELKLSTQDDFEQLLLLGGFPEPFLRGSELDAKRWSRHYRERLIQEDIVSLENLRDLGNLELLMLRLPDLVGSPLSVNALREELQVSHKTLENWLTVFSNLFAIFRIPPFGSPLIRAIKKDQKHYHSDWSLVSKKGPRFENLVACHLLKWVHFEQDTKARNVELRYFRDIEGREVDFVITENNQPIYAIECKSSADSISPHLNYFAKKFPSCESWQITAEESQSFVNQYQVKQGPALAFLRDFV